MAEEKKEVAPEEVKKAAKKKEILPEVAGKTAGKEKEEAPSEPKKTKKIRKLTLEEVEEKLKSVEATMGGTSSKYAQHLLHWREELLQKKKAEEMK
jgi:hypothetical protein